MLRRLLNCIFFILVSASAYSQLLEEAFKTAKREKKIVMIVVQSEKCTQCNVVAEQGLSSEIAKRAINASAVLLKVNKVPDELSGPYSLYFVYPNFFGVIYTDADKNILQVYNGSASTYMHYIDNLDKALKENNNTETSLSQLVKDYYAKKNNFETAYKLIEKTVRVGLEPKDELIDELTQQAPADSATSLTFLQFVERAAPGLATAAQLYTVRHLDNFNMSWYRMNEPERIMINNRSYQKSIRKAIETKNPTYMFRVANSRQMMFQSSGPQVMQRVHQEVILQYYKGVKDTVNYIENANRFYDNYFMTVNVDSIHRVDSVKRANLFRPPANFPPPNNNGRVAMQTQTVAFNPAAQYYAGSLNEGAWNFYTNTKEPLYLSKALLWSKRAIEFMETPEIIDTYARLLYKTNNKAAAIEWETKAVRLNKERQFDSSEYEKVLDAMKGDLDKIDKY